MKSIKRILVSLIIVVLFSCSPSDDKVRNYPICLQSYIDGILQGKVSNPRRVIKLYLYNGEKFYTISDTSYSTEPAEIIVDANCNTVCLIGGMDGGTTCSEDFLNGIQFVEIVWEDPR